jgi:hypothetical protein
MLNEPSTIHDILPDSLLDRQVWKDLVDAFDELMLYSVDGPRRQLEELRFLKPDSDSKVLGDVCRMLGFDLSEDLLNMSVNKFIKLASQIGMYPDTNGTENFVKFISMMTNGTCTVSYLWTKDYVNFYESPSGLVLNMGGSWFKTTHIDLNMGFSTLDGLKLKDGQTLGQKIIEIFYQQAPAALVVHSQTFTVDIPVEEIAFGATVVGSDRVYTLYGAG